VQVFKIETLRQHGGHIGRTGEGAHMAARVDHQAIVLIADRPALGMRAAGDGLELLEIAAQLLPQVQHVWAFPGYCEYFLIGGDKFADSSAGRGLHLMHVIAGIACYAQAGVDVCPVCFHGSYVPTEGRISGCGKAKQGAGEGGGGFHADPIDET